jgi:hypothetical protein
MPAVEQGYETSQEAPSTLPVRVKLGEVQALGAAVRGWHLSLHIDAVASLQRSVKGSCQFRGK